MRVAPVLLALVLALAAIGLACVPAATPLPTATPTGERAVLPTPTPAPPARPPIITEAQAIEMGTFMTRFGGPEVSGSQQVRNPEARLMTLAEFEDRFSGYQSTGDRSRPVWVVTVEGEWSDAGIVPPEYRRKYGYGNAVIDAHTGESISGGMRFEPFRLEEAERLDPASFPTYPLDVPLSYAKEVVRFPVSEPTYLPPGFALARVTLDFVNPLPEALTYPVFTRQAVVLDYKDADDKAFQVFQSGGEMPDELLQDGDKVTVQGAQGRARADTRGAWLAWTAAYPDAQHPGSTVHVSYVLRSPTGSVSLDELLLTAESLRAGQLPLPTPTPAATATRPNWPVPSPTMTPTPTGFPISCQPDATTAPCGSGSVVGQPYSYRLYTHCGIHQAYFDGRWWIASPPLDDGNLNPPPGWDNPTDTGVMMLVQADRARFTNTGGLSADFRPAPPSYQQESCY